MRRLLLTVVLALMASPTANAVTIVGAPGEGHPPPRLQHWADSSLVPTPDVTVTVHMTNCPGYTTPTACAVPGEIWLCPVLCHRSEFRHELGHQFDYYVMNDAARTAFMGLIGHTPDTGGRWREGTDTSPHEQFAEAWRLCAAVRHVNPDNMTASHGFDELSHRDYDRACAIIRFAAFARGLA